MPITHNSRKNQDDVRLAAICPSCDCVGEDNSLSKLRDYLENKALPHADMLAMFGGFVASSAEMGPLTDESISGLCHLLDETRTVLLKISDLVDDLDSCEPAKQTTDAKA